MKNFTPDERAADANIENTRGRAKPDTGFLWGICRRKYKSRGNRGESEAARGAEGETEEGTGRYKERKIWTECHARGRGKTLSTIENPKVLTVFSVGTLGFSIVLSVGGGKKINPTIYIYVRKDAAKFTRQGLRRKKKTGSTLQVLPVPNHFVHFEYGKTRKCEL